MGKILRAKQAMAKLGIKKSKFYDDISAGKLPGPIRQGRAVGYDEAEIDAYIESLKAERDRDYKDAVSKQPPDPPNDEDEANDQPPR